MPFADSINRWNSLKKVITAVLIALMFILYLPTNTTIAVSSITIYSPNGQENVFSEAKDFATSKFSDPWDMSNKGDIGLLVQNFRNTYFSGGKWNGTTNNRAGHIWLQWGGYPGSYPNGREGIINKINADYYKRFSFRMYSSRSGNARLWWFWTQNMKSRKWLNIPISSGWNTYMIDLPSTWYGSVMGLRFDPLTASDTKVIIDWVRLTPIENNNINITWDDVSSQNTATIFIDDNSTDYDGSPIAEVVSGYGTNIYSFDTSGLASGNYYVYIGKDGDYSRYSSAPIKINQSPVLEIIEPDETGGADWASTYLHNSWDMRRLSDARLYKNIGAKRTSRGILRGTNYRQTRKKDPFMWMQQRNKTINTGFFRYLTFRYRYDGGFDLRRGTMSRFMWLIKGRGWNTSDDIVTYTGWRTYTVDLKKIRLNGGRAGWRGRAAIFRFDPHEDSYSRRFYLDNIKLAGEDRVSSVFSIKYRKTDSDNSSATLYLYWDADKSFGNGNENLIVTKTIENGSGSYRWRPSRSLRRKVWIYAKVTDGINTTGFYSTGMLRVHM